ncbi:MAG: 50S ribosomal protein L28 [Deltaproteobacteria bacterium]|jgi:large subunit ribosomal protein L28|nr:50S ribosomal protein L28 [Deltaproteobacteria bacterium]MBT6435290.1 50S ribosomal protein L28 [Deltaproteobacteria bacterium]MBT6492769.1 50S ribosomal protein L28 [Deltaproteobacteria bacterium]
MSRVCQVTGKKPMFGNNVSHSNIKTRMRQLPNIQKRRFWVEAEQRWVQLTVSAKGIKVINKRGINSVLKDIRARGERIK